MINLVVAVDVPQKYGSGAWPGIDAAIAKLQTGGRSETVREDRAPCPRGRRRRCPQES